MKYNKVVVNILAAFVAIFAGVLISSAWTARWHPLEQTVQPSKIISSQEVGENLQYLYDQVSVARHFETCDFKFEEDIDCKVPYTCNCGKYGCSTCYAEGKRTDLKISCPGKTPLTFNGSCRDPREEMQCGKYGCTCGDEQCSR